MTRGWNVRSHNIHSEQLNASREEFHTFMTVLQGQMLASERVASGENCANQVFQAPAASDLFTGRTALLIHVREAFNLGNYRSGRNVEKYSKVDKSTPPDSSTSGADDRMNPTRPQNGARPSYQPPPDLGRAQKRFILIGLGGSGKTEFCRKFAEQNQARYSMSPLRPQIQESDIQCLVSGASSGLMQPPMRQLSTRTKRSLDLAESKRTQNLQ